VGRQARGHGRRRLWPHHPRQPLHHPQRLRCHLVVALAQAGQHAWHQLAHMGLQGCGGGCLQDQAQEQQALGAQVQVAALVLRGAGAGRKVEWLLRCNEMQCVQKSVL
jgi:hypothetical protein